MQLNIFKLAEAQIIKERRQVNEWLILKYALEIRKWLDKHSQSIALKIMQGDNIYFYNGRIKTYTKRI